MARRSILLAVTAVAALGASGCATTFTPSVSSGILEVTPQYDSLIVRYQGLPPLEEAVLHAEGMIEASPEISAGTIVCPGGVLIDQGGFDRRPNPPHLFLQWEIVDALPKDDPEGCVVKSGPSASQEGAS